MIIIMSFRITSYLFKSTSFKRKHLILTGSRLTFLQTTCNVNLLAARSFTNLFKHQHPQVISAGLHRCYVRSLNSDTSTSEETGLNFYQLVPNNNPSKVEIFSDYGLGDGFYPHQCLQKLLEIFHSNLEIGWIPTIALVTILLRILAVPTYIKMRQFNVHSQNNFPEQMKRQFDMLEGNPIERQKKRLEFMEFMKEKKLNPVKPLLYAAPMSLIFISFFSALRGIVAAKLPSFVHGGILWFHDLTIPDPYYILPLLSCLSLHILIKSGAASSEIGPAEQVPFMKKILLWFPLVLLPFAIFQPSCMFVFWLTSNFFSLILMLLFLNVRVKRFFNIPKTVVHPPSSLDILNARTFSNSINRRNEETRKEAIKKVTAHFQKLKDANSGSDK